MLAHRPFLRIAAKGFVDLRRRMSEYLNEFDQESIWIKVGAVPRFSAY